MSNPVVVAHGTASLAALVCKRDKTTGSGLYREAIAATINLSESAFTQRGTTVLPAASFTGLWKYVVPAALKCDPELAAFTENPHARQRMDQERRNANATLTRAYNMVSRDPAAQSDRAAQMGNAALDAADPETLSFETLTLLLSQLRERAPDLADDLFARALDFIMNSPAPDPASLQELGKFLFTAPRLLDQPDQDEAHDTQQVSSVSLENLTATRYSTNPDDVQAFIETAVQMFDMPVAVNRNPIVAYSVAIQLLPYARDLLPGRADQLEKQIAELQAPAAAASGRIQALFGGSQTPDPDSGDPATRNFWLIGQVRSACAGGRFDQARALLQRVSDLPSRGQVDALITFAESASALERKEFERALPLANGLKPGVKRTLLYAAMMALADNRDSTLQVLQLAEKDAEALPAEQRIRLFSAVAASALVADAETALSVANQVVSAYNDAYTSPRSGTFDPRSTRRIYNPKADVSTDSSLVLPGSRAFYEAVQLEKGRHNFPLRVPSVTAYSLAAFLQRAGALDPARLEALILSLRDENRQVNSLLVLAALRLKIK